MNLVDVLRLADRYQIDSLPGSVLAAIWQLNCAAPNVDRNNPQLVAAHNLRVICAHGVLAEWESSEPKNMSDLRYRFRTLVLDTYAPEPKSPSAYSLALPGARRLTAPIEPTVNGTGLRRQGKTPRYDEQGHLI